MELSKSIRMAVDTGKTVLGSVKSKKLALTGGAKLIVIAKNCPPESKQDLMHYCQLAGVPCIEYQGTSVELGVVCGKPFTVSALSVLDAGNSDILSATTTKK